MIEMNTPAIKRLFEDAYPKLYLFAFRMLGCKETAQDLVQDAFVYFLEKKEDMGDHDMAKAYLYGVVKHAALNKIRHRKVVDRFNTIYRTEQIEEDKILQMMIRAEVIGELYAALESLPKGCAEICKMGYLEGRKNAEIAVLLNISINTVKTQKQRALTLLRNKLSPEAFSIVILILFYALIF